MIRVLATIATTMAIARLMMIARVVVVMVTAPVALVAVTTTVTTAVVGSGVVMKLSVAVVVVVDHVSVGVGPVGQTGQARQEGEEKLLGRLLSLDKPGVGHHHDGQEDRSDSHRDLN